MEKNTVLAIVFSAILIIGWAILMPLIQSKNKVNIESPEVAQAIEQTAEKTPEAAISENVIEEETEEEPEVVLSEEFKTITTKHAEIKFTSKGGDILSYKLINHKDIDTKEGVQISDCVTDLNRTCALTFGSAADSIDNTIYNVETEGNTNTETQKIIFTGSKKINGKKYFVRKEYTIVNDEYMFKLDIKIHTDANGLDVNGAAYTLRTSPQIGPRYNPKSDRYENRQFIALPYNGKKVKKIILAKNQFNRWEKDFVWGATAGKYFEEIVIPTDTSIIGNVYYSSKVEQDDYANAQAFFERRSFTGSDISDTYYLYFGPRNEKELKIYNSSEKNYFKLSGHRLSESLQSSGWLSWLEAILKWCLEMLHKIIPNWGVCIIILTILLRVIMFPLSKKQSLGTLKMQQLQPKMQALQKKYANDQQKLQQEMSKLYKEADYNPASGCLPLIFQFLILFAMFNLFNNYFDFRGSVFIPGWVSDLSKGDSIYKFKKSIGIFGENIRLLPIIYVGTQILSSKITQMQGMSTAQNKKSTQMLMMYGLPLMFFFMFYNAPSGLLLFWLTSNILAIVQQVIINQMMKKKREEMGTSQPVIAKGKNKR